MENNSQAYKSLDSLFGKTTPTVPNAGPKAPTWSDEIKAAQTQTTKPKTPSNPMEALTSGPLPKIGQFTTDIVKGLAESGGSTIKSGGDIVSPIRERFYAVGSATADALKGKGFDYSNRLAEEQNITKGIQSKAEDLITPANDTQKVSKFVGDVAQLAVPAGEAGKASEAFTLAKSTPEFIKEFPKVAKLAPKVAKTVGEGIGFTAGQNFTDNEIKSPGDYATNVGLNMLFPIGGAVAESLGIGSGGFASAGDFISTISKKSPKDISNILKSYKDEVLSKFATKTEKQILNTPIEQVHKLSGPEVNYYFAKQLENIKEPNSKAADLIKQQYETTLNTMKSNKDASLNVIKENNKVLENNIANATTKEAQALKPVVQQAIKENGNTYRQLIEEDMAPHLDTYIEDKSIADSIRKQFPNDPYSSDPYKADRIISELGLTEGGTQKVGELYSRIKGIKSEISSSGRKGTKVFSADDMNTIDKISALSKALQDSGVDLSRANNFWREYAPLRDKIVSKVQPFTPAGAETPAFATFAKSIRTSVEGKDPYNENFIRATEDLLGVKIGNSDTRKLISNLSDSEKRKIAIEMEHESLMQQIKQEKAKQLISLEENLTEQQKALELQKLSVAQKANYRNNIKKALWSVLGGAGTIAVGKQLFD